MRNPLPLPTIFDPKHAEDARYAPDSMRVFDEANAWRKQHALRPATSDARQLHLLLIDVQKDFCFPEGSLYVGGRSGRGGDGAPRHGRSRHPQGRGRARRPGARAGRRQ